MTAIIVIIALAIVLGWEKFKEFDAKWQNGQVSDTGKVMFVVVIVIICIILFFLTTGNH